MTDEMRKNLMEAGYNKGFISEFEACLGDEDKCMRLIAAHRKKLLDAVHRGEKRLSCLDYLEYTLKKARR